MNGNESSSLTNSLCSCSGCQSRASLSLPTNGGECRSYCTICASHLEHHGQTQAAIPSREALPEQKKDEKRYPCKNKCGEDITFDSNIRSTTGKPIPLNAVERTPHVCQNAPRVGCKFCSAEIYFELTLSGKSIPLNQDGSFHACPKWPFKVTSDREEALSVEDRG